MRECRISAELGSEEITDVALMSAASHGGVEKQERSVLAQ
jgi:tellurite resistance protein